MTGVMGVTRRPAIALALLALSLSGCREAFAGPTPDDLSTWSRTPLPPDARLAEQALNDSSCGAGFEGPGQIRVALQDRRTASAAAFFMTAPAHFGSCLLASGSGGGSSTNVVPSLHGSITVDEQGSGTVGNGHATTLGGLAAQGVAAVTVDLDDGSQVVASVGNGYWLSWWPLAAAAVRVTALDAAGGPAAVLEPSPDGWAEKGGTP